MSDGGAPKRRGATGARENFPLPPLDGPVPMKECEVTNPGGLLMIFGAGLTLDRLRIQPRAGAKREDT